MARVTAKDDKFRDDLIDRLRSALEDCRTSGGATCLRSQSPDILVRRINAINRIVDEALLPPAPEGDDTDALSASTEKLTPSLRKIAFDAAAAGYAVEGHRLGLHLDVFKRDGRSGRISIGVRIYPDGTAHRLDIPLNVCKVIRTARDIRTTLNL